MTSQRILVIDHQQNLKGFYQTWLEPIGFAVQFAESGSDSLSLIEAERFDLALLELSLPDTDSLEILRHLKTHCPRTPVIVSFEKEVVEVSQITTALQLGAAAFVEKPYQSDVLLESIWRAQAQYPAGVICGNLRDLSLPNLITLMCNEGKKACLEIESAGQVATLFFEMGQVVHASLNGKSGGEVVFEALGWEDGSFVITSGRSAPKRTIETSWSGLLLEGLGRIDEATFDQEQLEAYAQPANRFEPTTGTPPSSSSSFSINLDYETQMQIKDRLGQLHLSVDGRCTLLVNRNGRLFHAQGDIEESRVLALAALIASSFSANNEVAKMLAYEGEEPLQFYQSLQEGRQFSLYLTQVGSDWILAIAFNPDRVNLGLARQLTLQTTSDLGPLFNEAQSVAEQRQEALNMVDEAFQETVDDNFADLFAQVLED